MGTRRGFTLVELMITVAVLGLLAGIGVPYLLVSLPTFRVNAAVRQVLADLRLAKSLAVGRGVGCLVVFDAADASYAVVLDTDGTAGASGGDETVKTVSIPGLYEGIAFGSDGSADPVTFGADVAIFKAGGTAETGGVYLRPGRDAGVRRDRERRVTVVGSTGRARAYRWNGTGWE